MDIRVFSTFLEVAKVRHFGKASENLHITQAAVSARIKTLESYFGTVLFTRDRNNIKLTSAGERLISYAETIITSFHQAKNELTLEDTKSRQIAIGGTANVWNAYLQQAFTTVSDHFPDYGFVADLLSREQLSRGLMERTVDMSFSFEPIKLDELDTIEIGQIPLVLVAHEPMTKEQVLAENYIYVDWGTAFAAEHARHTVAKVTPMLRTSSASIALDYLFSKGGCAYLPLPMVESGLAEGRLHRVADAREFDKPVYLSYRKKSVSLEAIMQIVLLLEKK